LTAGTAARAAFKAASGETAAFVNSGCSGTGLAPKSI
jgi:hypothetical protein